MQAAQSEPRGSEVDRLATLIELSRSLTAELHLQEIIHRILHSAVRIIPAAEAGVLFLHHRDRKALVVNDAIGFGPSVYELVVKPGEGLSGRAFTTHQAKFYTR